MKKYPVIITVIFIALALVIPASAQIFGRSISEKEIKTGFPDRRAALAEINKVRASLSIEQRDAIRKLHYAFLDETVELRSEIKKKSDEFRELLKKENPGKSEVMSARQAMMDLRTALFEKKFDLRQKQREIISAGDSEG